MNVIHPTLLVDKIKCIGNIKAMMAKAKQSNACLRPHFKTHHSAEIANWFREEGVTACTVSSVDMAAYFADHGWGDITIAFPFNPLAAEEITRIALGRALNILIESEESLVEANKRIDSTIGFFIKIDVGTHRTGIDPRNTDLIQRIINGSTDKVCFKGFLAHAGHTYGAKDKENVQWIFKGAEKILVDLKARFGGIVSYGDTPSCSMMSDFSAFDELRPGNFIFYDWMQHQIGACSMDQIAVCLACPVVAIHEDRNEVVVHCGGVHLSKDALEEGREKTFGKAVQLTPDGWGHEIIGNVVRLSQEHGIIKMSPEKLAHVKIGTLIGVIPVHSCLTADLQGHYLSTTGERIEKIIKN